MALSEHKVAIVTGGARGLGRAVVEALLDRGLKVGIADVLADVGEATASELLAKHGKDRVVFLLCDVTKPEDIKDAWTKCEKSLGTVDLLVNNAGVGDEIDWQKTIMVNFVGCFAMLHEALARMGTDRGGKGGRVVNVASTAALQTYPFVPVYSATKAGIVSLTRAMGHPSHMALSGVQVQALCPGAIDTSLVDEVLSRIFFKGMTEMVKEATNVERLPPAEVAAAMVQLIDEGPNGGVMVVEHGKPLYYASPSVQ